MPRACATRAEAQGLLGPRPYLLLLTTPGYSTHYSLLCYLLLIACYLCARLQVAAQPPTELREWLEGRQEVWRQNVQDKRVRGGGPVTTERTDCVCLTALKPKGGGGVSLSIAPVRAPAPTKSKPKRRPRVAAGQPGFAAGGASSPATLPPPIVRSRQQCKLEVHAATRLYARPVHLGLTR